MPGTKQKEGEWGVRDKNARELAQDNSGRVIPRIHEARPGKTYPLTFDEPYYMPESDARIFLKDPAFAVTDHHGNPVAPLSETALARKAPDALAPNMVIADVNELTDEALLTRVAQLNGGSMFTASTPREVLIRFIIEEQALESAPGYASRPTGAGDEGEAEEMSEDGTDAQKLLEGR